MKRFWLGVSLLGVMVVLGCWTGGKIMDTALPCAGQLDQAAALAMAEDWPGAKQAAERAQGRWQENRHFSACVTDHRALDEIDAIFEELQIYGAREDAESFAAGCVFLAEKFRDLGYSQELSWWNLL